MIVCPPVLDCYISTLDVPGVAQALAECRHKMCDLIGWLCTQIADYRGLLLGDCRERPCRRCTAEQRDEIAALCMSGKQHSEGRRGFGHDRVPVATGSPQALRILNRE